MNVLGSRRRILSSTHFDTFGLMNQCPKSRNVLAVFS